MNINKFEFSDLISGYVVNFSDKNSFTMKTSDGKNYTVHLGSNLFGRMLRNLNEPYSDCTNQIRLFLKEGQMVLVYVIDVKAGKEHKVFASEFGDDYDAIPMYEQIYALSGLTQTYRVTGNPLILRDIEMTNDLFEKFFHDKERGGYYSHIDPIFLNADDDNLGSNKLRKN